MREFKAIALMIEGHSWMWADREELFLRLRPGSVPKSVHTAPRKTDVELIRAALGNNWSGPALPVAADRSTIGGVAVDVDTLRMVESHAQRDLTWRPWVDWLGATAPDGELVALWKMSEKQRILEVSFIARSGELWMTNGKFCMLATLPAEALDRVRATATDRPAVASAITKIIVKGASGTVVSCTRGQDGTAHVGSSRVPADQLDFIQGTHGMDLEWRWTGPLDPVVASKGGRVIAFVMPIPGMAAGGEG